MRRARLVRTLTFWLRPAFALRVVSRFQRIVGFDRAIALASSAFTALIPMALLVASILGRLGKEDVAESIVRRYGLTGGGADAVRALFSFDTGPGESLGVLGSLFLLVSALSFTRAAQRLFEQTWELPALSVRNTLNGLRWLLGLVVFALASGWLHALLSGRRVQVLATVCEVPLTSAFLVWSGWLLTARRRPWRDMIPFGVIGGLLSALYAVGSAVYLPRLFSSYATRYGPLGAVFALIAALFGAMLTLVGSDAVGREVSDELGRIRRGEAPPDDEIRREWATVVDQTRERWQTAREDLARRRARRSDRRANRKARRESKRESRRDQKRDSNRDSKGD
ncbi:YihY/virulence factor BrkB family protein [Streptacidiphilus neutrinimicus]|uniref:YihY/virulence factor BrkB family protein n=1 Tax=Streptacidiphilus neutrinimicus TaxID=105420 RepID=UPI000AE037AE|nr:YhjD/YihY/BrkB family envelope integrity protein [Streptacidiphilus neutrinimicus]